LSQMGPRDVRSHAHHAVHRCDRLIDRRKYCQLSSTDDGHFCRSTAVMLNSHRPPDTTRRSYLCRVMVCRCELDDCTERYAVAKFSVRSLKKFKRKVPLFCRYLNFLKTRHRTDRKKPPCQKPDLILFRPSIQI